MKGLRIAGHALPVGAMIHGPGTVACQCGEQSPILPSRAARLRWHRAHKDVVAGDAAPVELLRRLILSRLTCALDGHGDGCEPGLCGHGPAVAVRAVADLHVPAAVQGLGVVCAGCRVVGGTPVRPDRCRTLAALAAALGLAVDQPGPGGPVEDAFAADGQPAPTVRLANPEGNRTMRCSGCYDSFSGPWCDNCDQWPCVCLDDEPDNGVPDGTD